MTISEKRQEFLCDKCFYLGDNFDSPFVGEVYLCRSKYPTIIILNNNPEDENYHSDFSLHRFLSPFLKEKVRKLDNPSHYKKYFEMYPWEK